MEESYRYFAGIDWATEVHQVCVLDRDRAVLGERAIEHSGAGLARLFDWLAEVSGSRPETVAVAIETPRGAVVESLVERGFHVYAINPKQLDRFRDRHNVAGAKDDRRDALVLADSVRTDGHLFRRVRLDDPLVIQIREWSRTDEELAHEQRRLANRLRDLLVRFWPQLLRLSEAADEAWLWDLLEAAPTPETGAQLGRARVKKLLKRRNIRRLSVEQVVAALEQSAPWVAPGTAEAISGHIGLLVPRLRLVQDQRRDCQRRLERLLEDLEASVEPSKRREHHDVAILRSLPGIGISVAAVMLAEASGPLGERNYHALRAQAGSAPVTESSGKRSGRRGRVLMRRSCNARLRNALYHWARVAVSRDEYARARYASLRARGHSHGRALRGLADRLLGRLVAMLRQGTLYDAARTGAQPAAALAAESP